MRPKLVRLTRRIVHFSLDGIDDFEDDSRAVVQRLASVLICTLVDTGRQELQARSEMN